MPSYLIGRVWQSLAEFGVKALGPRPSGQGRLALSQGFST